MVTSVVLNLLSSLISYSNNVYKEVAYDYEEEWNHFVLFFQEELNHYKYVDHSENNLFVRTNDTNSSWSRIQLKSNKIYRTGHQPFLYKVKNWYISYNAPILYIKVQFTNEQEFADVFYLEEYK